MTADGAELGRLVKERREARRMSQRALARAAGVTSAYISLIERGLRAPDRPVVERLAEALADAPAERDVLVRAAGYAPASAQRVAPARDGALARLERLLRDAGLTPEQHATVESLVLIYATGLTARAKEGRPLVSDLAAPWQARVLEALQEKMAEDFEHFRESYLHRVFDS